MKSSATAKPIPAWKQFEVLIANIQRQLAPGAVVHHNKRIIGKSGRRRQFDVVAEQTVGLVKVSIGFECKKYTRRVSIERVEAFVGRLHDAGLPVGVMISELGFDAGAIAVASQENVLLFTCREAEETDWNALLGENAWFHFIFVAYSFPRAIVNWGTEAPFHSMSFDTVLWVRDLDTSVLVELGAVGDLIVNEVRLQPTRIGDWPARIEPLHPLVVKGEIDLLPVQSIDFTVTMKATAYPVSLKIGDGRVLEQVGGTAGFVEVASESFDWRKLIETVKGMELRQDEYDELKAGNKTILSVHNVQNLKQFLRLSVTKISPPV